MDKVSNFIHYNGSNHQDLAFKYQWDQKFIFFNLIH